MAQQAQVSASWFFERQLAESPEGVNDDLVFLARLDLSDITTDSTSGIVAADPDRSPNTMTYCIDKYGLYLSIEEVGIMESEQGSLMRLGF